MEFPGEREQLVPKVVVYLRQSHMKIFSIFKNVKKWTKKKYMYIQLQNQRDKKFYLVRINKKR